MKSLFIPCSRDGFQVAAFVLHCETIFWGQVHGLSWHGQKLQLLDQDCQEEVDFVSCNHLSNAAALSHTKHHHLLPLQLVDLSAVSTQETVWVEGKRVCPLLTETQAKMTYIKLDKNANTNAGPLKSGLTNCCVGCKSTPRVSE